MSMDEFIKLLPSRQRRSLLKGLTNEQRILMEHVRQSRKENGSKPTPVKSHVRDMIVIPEMLGLTLQLHSGKEYVAIEIKPEMIGHFVGEFAITNQKVVHGTPGIGASRSSMYVPLKEIPPYFTHFAAGFLRCPSRALSHKGPIGSLFPDFFS